MISQQKPRGKSPKKRSYIKKSPHILTAEDFPKIVDSITKAKVEAQRDSAKFWLGLLCLLATLVYFAAGGVTSIGMVLMAPLVAYLSRN